jgi:hypothetical protein
MQSINAGISVLRNPPLDVIAKKVPVCVSIGGA